MKKTNKTFLIGVLSCAMLACTGVSLKNATPVSAEDGAVDTQSNVFYVAEGAEIRESETLADTGIRFRTLVNKNAFDSLLGTYENAVAGMIMLPSDTMPTNITINELEASKIAYKAQDYETLGTFALVQGGERYYHYSLALKNLIGDNYAREMSAVGYIKIPASDFAEGTAATTTVTLGEESFTATSYQDSYYIYTTYDEAKHSRSMYEVAKLAYADGNTAKAITSYLDSVAILNYDASGSLSVVKDGYDSPYEVVADGNSYTVRTTSEEGKELKCLVVNGNIEKEYPVALSETKTLHVMQRSEDVSIASDGTVGMMTDYLQNKGATAVNNMNMGYLAFDGKYEAGTYLSVTFTGANAPYIMFFANNINTKLANPYTNGSHATNDTGVLFTSGFLYNSEYDTEGNVTKVGVYDSNVYGPYKIDRGLDSAAVTQSNSNNNWWDPMGLSKLLGDNKDKTYTLVIGTEWVNGVLNVVQNLYTVTGGGVAPISGSYMKPKYNWVCSNTTALGGTITQDVISSGSIILYAPLSGTGKTGLEGRGQGNVSFTYTAPQKGVFEPDGLVMGTVPDANGNVTHDGEGLLKGGYSWNIWGCGTNRYTAFMGDYGVGTYIDFEFTGKMLPQVMLFGKVQAGDEANIGNFSAYGNGVGSGANKDTTTDFNREGVVVLNLATDNGGATGNLKSGLQVYGPKRIGKYNQTVENGGADPRFGAGAIATSTSTAFNHYQLVDGTNYKYTIGTCLAEDGTTVMLDVTLINLDTSETVATEKFALPNISKDSAGYICMHAPFTYANGTAVTFKTSLPYKK